jgi:hypothetical protein
LADNAPVDRLPLMASGPLQPPEAAQEVALVDLHDRVELDALATDAGDAVSVAVGVGVGAAPSPPPQEPSSSAPTAGHGK